MKFKIRYADQIVGVFSIIALSGLLFLIFSIGINQKWFSTKNYYYTYFDTADGMSVGMDLTYKGFSLGKIKSITLEGLMVRADYYVLAEYEDYIRENSLVELVTSPIGLGNSFIFHPSFETSELLPSGEQIHRIDSETGQQIIMEGKNTIKAHSDSIGAIISKVSTLLDSINALLVDLDDTVTGKADTPIAGIILNLESISSEIATVLAKISGSSDLITPILGRQIYLELASAFENINKLTSEATVIAGDAETLVEGVVPQVDDIIGDLDILLIQIQDVMEGLKKNPLIKGGVPNRSRESTATTKIRDGKF